MGSFLYTVIVYPIELIVELLFVFVFKAFKNTGIAVVGVSLLVTLLSLPLYIIAERLQKEERDTRVRLQPGVSRIKGAFAGDEQYLMLSTYYRQHHYHPLFALRSSVSLLIQVPFFIAAYHFLSHLPHLQGESFFFIKDLSLPDQMVRLWGIPINVLPVAMTLINIVAGIIYTKGFPMRDKVQLYGMAGIFLVLLYNSPSGLVLYWTCNNVLSLVKNMFYKAKHPQRLLYVASVLLSVGFTVVVLNIKEFLPLSKQLVLYSGCAVIILIPVLLKLGKIVYASFFGSFSTHKNQIILLFVLSIAVLWTVCGFLIPANVIRSSPIEFAFTGTVNNPLSYIVSNGTFFFGLFIVWPLFIFGLSGKQGRTVISVLFSILAIGAIANLFVFKGDYGLVSRVLLFDEPSRLEATTFQVVVPILCMLLIAGLALLAVRKGWVRFLANGLVILLLASGSMGVYGATSIQKAYTVHARNIQQNSESATNDLTPIIPLSRERENIVVLFLDRAINSYLPIVFDQFPELYEQFSGFTYYPNTVTPGVATLLGSPPIMGGYEYIPEAMNKRDSEFLVDKHNEAMLVLPKLFSDAGYQVSVFDPPYSNYKWSNDYTPFKEYPEISVKALDGVYSYRYKRDHPDDDSWGPDYESRTIKRRFPMFALMKIMVPALRDLFYYEGTYFLLDESTQNITKFIDSYATLHYLPELTTFDTPAGNYVFLVNDTTHEPLFLQAPEYVPRIKVTNTYSPLQEEYDVASQIHYHVNVAALRAVGIWFDFLKAEGVYDNTRFIIVSDHGNGLRSPAFKDFERYEGSAVVFNSLLLIKDFYSDTTFNTNLSFMTTADVPLMAIKDLPIETTNPFTGVDMSSVVKKDSMELYTIDLDPTTLRQKTLTFEMTKAFEVHDSIFDESNWVKFGND